MNVLITGASGFLGRHVILELQKKTDCHVFAVVRSLEKWRSYDWTHSLQNLTVVESSFSDLLDLELASIDVVVHAAATVVHSRLNSDAVYNVNVDGTKSVATFCKKHSAKLVFISTCGVVACFDSIQKKAFEDAPYLEREISGWPYYDSKQKAEEFLLDFFKELEQDLVVIRPPAMFGPNDHQGRTVKHFTNFMEGKLPVLVKEGGIHFIDVRDAAKAIVRAIQEKDLKKIYHLPGHSYSIPGFYTKVAELACMKKPKRFLSQKNLLFLSRFLHKLKPGNHLIPDPVLLEMARYHWGIDSHHAKNDLNFIARDPETTLQDTVEWVQTCKKS